MIIRRKATLIDLARLCGQIEAQVMDLEDPDWYAPRFGIDGAIHCVRVPMAGSPLRALLKAQRASAAKGSEGSDPEGSPYLVPAFKSGSSRHGLKGMSSASRREALKRATVLGAFPGCCTFLTQTFTDAQVDLLALVPDGMQLYQDRYRHSINRRLGESTDRPLFVLRVEMHPKRSLEMGLPIPHLHGVLRTKSHAKASGWWLDHDAYVAAHREAIRAVIKAAPFEMSSIAVCKAMGRAIRFEHLCSLALAVDARVEHVLARNPSRYLAKYISKNEDGLGGRGVEGFENLIPHQWLQTSTWLVAIVRSCGTRLPPEMGEWLWRNAPRLVGMGLGRHRDWHPPGCDRHQITSFYPRGVEEMAQIWELFLFETGYGRWLEEGAPPLAGEFAGLPVRELFPRDFVHDSDSLLRDSGGLVETNHANGYFRIPVVGVDGFSTFVKAGDPVLNVGLLDVQEAVPVF